MPNHRIRDKSWTACRHGDDHNHSMQRHLWFVSASFCFFRWRAGNRKPFPPPITRISESSLIYFSNLLPFHHQDYRAISDLFQQASTFQVACLETAAIPTTITMMEALRWGPRPRLPRPLPRLRRPRFLPRLPMFRPRPLLLLFRRATHRKTWRTPASTQERRHIISLTIDDILLISVVTTHYFSQYFLNCGDFAPVNLGYFLTHCLIEIFILQEMMLFQWSISEE
jgi:hypothetical protein